MKSSYPVGATWQPHTRGQDFATAENLWLPFIRNLYSEHRTRSYFLPLCFFSHVLYVVVKVHGEWAVVLDDCPVEETAKGKSSEVGQSGSDVEGDASCAKRSATNLGLSENQNAGNLFVKLSKDVHEKKVQRSQFQCDQAHRCVFQSLKTLSESQSQPMMTISNFHYGKYMKNLLTYFPGISKAVLAEFQAEADLLIIHRTQGLLVWEVKSVGGKEHFQNSTEDDQNLDIIKRVKEAAMQLQKQDAILHRLLHDVNVQVTKLVAFPNVTSALLRRALKACPDDAKALCRCVGRSVDVDDQPLQEALRFCLCQDQLLPDTNMASWWRDVILQLKPDPNMTDNVYDRLLARLCGPATTVAVPTVFRPRQEFTVRTTGDAVAAMGHFVSSLVLCREQLDILSSPSQRMYLCGPSGTGKSVVLYLKAREWLLKGQAVHVLSLSDSSQAVSLLIQMQLLWSLEDAPEARRSSVELQHLRLESDEALHDAVDKLDSLSPNKDLFLIVDEVNYFQRFSDFCRQLHDRLGDRLKVWAAGTKGKPSGDHKGWLTVEKLTVPLRCPPAVHREVKSSVQITGVDPLVDSYSREPVPVATDGPEVRWLKHYDVPGHTGVRPWECPQCGHNVADELQRLGVAGKDSDNFLQWRDVLILCWDPPSLQDSPMLQALESREVPLAVLPLRGATKEALRDVSLALTDRVTLAAVELVAGLERRVVVGMGGVGYDRLCAMSRCTAQLIWIDTPATS